MASATTSRRAVWAFSAFGILAIAATVVLLLSVGRQFATALRRQERAANLRHAEQCAALLRGSLLLARLREVVDRHPEAVSLLQIADEVRQELDAAAESLAVERDIQAIVVDENLRPIWPLPTDLDRNLLPCAQHILGGRECVYVMPHEPKDPMDGPSHLCYTCPLERGGQVLGGLIIHRQLAAKEDVFSVLNRRLTWVAVGTQAVLALVLGAIALYAARAVAQAERQSARGERLAALGNLAAGVAHEIRNPLNTIALTCRYLERLAAQGIADPAKRAEVNTNFEIVAGELARLGRTLDDFVMLSKPTDLALRECDLEALVDAELALFARELDDAGVRLVRERAGPLPVAADPDRLSQVFGNIIRNSIQAMRDGGTLTVATRQADGAARAAFADTGPGFPPASLHRVCEPYYTTKRSGLGLGLALALRIVEAHGGSLQVANQPSGGALVTVNVPLRTPPSETGHGS